MTIFTQKPNLSRSWLRHLKTQSWKNTLIKIISSILTAVRQVTKSINIIRFFNFRKRSAEIVKIFNSNYVKTAKKFSKISRKSKNQLSPKVKFDFIKLDFVYRHSGLFILTFLVLTSNYLIGKSTQTISEEYLVDIPISESSAVSEEDLTKLVSKITKYTNSKIKTDPQKVVNRLIAKDAMVLTDGQYINKPLVLATSDISENQSTTAVASKKSITEYRVQGGDTISLIAQKFGISVATIKLANGLSLDTIKPGQKLTILPVSGILHIVKKGENLSSIVARYHGDLFKTIQENNLDQNSTIYAGQKIVIVGGRQPAPTQIASRSYQRNTSQRRAGQVSGAVHHGRGPNHFPFGWCTWYVASRRYIPWSGNAGAWPSQARRYGYQVGYTPAVGAIIVTGESRWGHVAYVESVHGNTVTVSEMNFTRWGRVNYRTLSAGHGLYIY